MVADNKAPIQRRNKRKADIQYSDDQLYSPPKLKSSGFLLAVVDLVASIGVVGRLLVTHDTLLTLLVAAGIIALFWGLSEAVTDFDTAAEQASTSFAWVSFVITFPLSTAISSSISRRERGFTSLSALRAALCSVVSGSRSWNLPGKQPDGADPIPDSANGKAVAALAISALKPMEAYLLAPTVSRARHFQISAFVSDREWVLSYQRSCQSEIISRLHRLEQAVDALRLPPRSMPPPHVSRINQYLQFVRANWEQLRFIKDYRQPLGLRTFSRLVILCLPLFYAPQLFSNSTSSWAVSLPLAMLTQLIFVGLFAIQRVLEDPFITDQSGHASERESVVADANNASRTQPSGIRVDAIRVASEFADTRNEIRRMLHSQHDQQAV